MYIQYILYTRYLYIHIYIYKYLHKYEYMVHLPAGRRPRTTNVRFDYVFRGRTTGRTGGGLCLKRL